MFSTEDLLAIAQLKSFLLEKTFPSFSVSEESRYIQEYKNFILSEIVEESIPLNSESALDQIELPPELNLSTEENIPSTAENAEVPSLEDVINSLKNDDEFLSKVRGESVNLQEKKHLLLWQFFPLIV